MNSLDFQIEIIKTNRKKSVSIQLKDGHVIVRAPSSLSDNRINDLIKKRTPWIKEKLEYYSKRSKVIEKKYIDGEIFSYLGKNYALKIIKSNDSNIKLKSGYFEVSLSVDDLNKSTKVRNLLLEWYKHHGLEYLKERTDEYKKIIDVLPCSVSIKNYKSRWGSCSINGAINYNWKIIQAPKKVIDYLVVHELCHLIEHNHSPKYWSYVERFIPNWKESRDWLKENSDILNQSFN